MYRLLLKQRLDEVESRIAAAAARAQRNRSDIQMVAVTKKFPAAVLLEAYQLGLRDFGENYVQEFEEKRAELPDCPGARYHFIGHLQSNKAKKAAEIFDVIHTVDSARLALRLNAELEAGAGRAGPHPGKDVLIEVKLSGEPAKAGAAPGDLPALVEAIRGCPHLRLLGLMTMPPWSNDAENRGRILRACVRWPRRTACGICPWGCRTTWKWPSRRARPSCAWGRPCLVLVKKLGPRKKAA